jgi:hypothetical protein
MKSRAGKYLVFKGFFLIFLFFSKKLRGKTPEREAALTSNSTLQRQPWSIEKQFIISVKNDF